MLMAIFLLLDAIVLLLTVLPLLPQQGWWSRVGEFPRVQIVLLAALLLAVQLFFVNGGTWEWLLNAALFACIVYQFVWIIPYTRLFRREVMPADRPVDEDRCISVLSANVLMSNRNVSALRKEILDHDPDVVLLLETDDWWEREMHWLRETHPHGLDCPLDNRYGMHLYSRLRLEDPCLEFLVQDGIPSMHADVHLKSGHHVRLRCLHPAPPSPTENETSRERDAELLVVGRAIAADARSVIATGDFNDVAWSPTTRLFRKISRLLDPRVGRGMFNTFHANIPVMRFPLDHVFHSQDFTLVDLQVLQAFGSDHLPIYYKLQYEPSAATVQEPLPADEEDQQQADDRIGKTPTRPQDVPDPGSQ